MDTMGHGADGGYGNSYAQTVGQRDYQGYFGTKTTRCRSCKLTGAGPIQPGGDRPVESVRPASDQYEKEYGGRYRDNGGTGRIRGIIWRTSTATRGTSIIQAYRDRVSDEQWQKR